MSEAGNKRPVGTDFSKDEDTKPTVAEEKRKTKKSKRNRGREDTKRKLEQDVNKKNSDTGKKRLILKRRT